MLSNFFFIVGKKYLFNIPGQCYSHESTDAMNNILFIADEPFVELILKIFFMCISGK